MKTQTAVSSAEDCLLRRACPHSGFAAFMAVLALLASGPQSGTIRGTASVAGTGELLPGVEVTATSEGVRQTAHTDEDGHLILSKLPGEVEDLSSKEKLPPSLRLQLTVRPAARR